jgi:hypothetical protein
MMSLCPISLPNLMLLLMERYILNGWNKVLCIHCFAQFLAIQLTTCFQTPEQLHSEKVPENLIPHKVVTAHLLFKLN